MAYVGKESMKITLNPSFSIETGELLSHDGQYEHDGPVILFDRALNKEATQAGQAATATGGALGASAAGIGSSLIPGLERDANNPPGMSPADLANQETMALQTAGGAAGGLKGSLALQAMRNRNPAGLNAATAAVSQGASRAAGQGVQGVLADNANLKQKQMSEAQSGLEGLYGVDTKGMLDAMGLVPEDVNAGVNADKTGWLQNTMGVLGTLGQLGSSAAKAAGLGA